VQYHILYSAFESKLNSSIVSYRITFQYCDNQSSASINQCNNAVCFIPMIWICLHIYLKLSMKVKIQQWRQKGRYYKNSWSKVHKTHKDKTNKKQEVYLTYTNSI